MNEPRMRVLSHHIPERYPKVHDWSRTISLVSSENVVMVLRQAIRRFGTSTMILSDNGSYFVGVRRENSKRLRKPTVFEEDLLGRGIELINSSCAIPKPTGSSSGCTGTECHCEVLSVYVECYIERRLLFSLGMAKLRDSTQGILDQEDNIGSQGRGSQLDGGGVELLVDIISVYCTKINQPKNS